MSNETVPANAEAMPVSLKRRSFLAGLAVASALSGATAAQAARGKAENCELLRLGKLFDQAHADLIKAADRLPPLKAAYHAIAPTGEGLVFEAYTDVWRRHHSVAEVFADPTSEHYEPVKTAEGASLHRICSYRTARMIEVSSKRDLPYLRFLHNAASEFEAGMQSALSATGLDVALQAYWRADLELRKVVQALSEQRASTMEGIALKIRATGAYAALGKDERFSASQWLARAVWSDLEDVA